MRRYTQIVITKLFILASISIFLLEKLITELNDLIFSTKTLYYENLAKKLNNPLLQTKTYLSVLKTFCNDTKNPAIPSLLEDHKFVTDMKTKANIFNNFFAEQCAPLKNDSKLPSNQIYLTQSRLVSLNFNDDGILEIVRALNPHKALGYDDISIRMIKICDKSLLAPLIFYLKIQLNHLVIQLYVIPVHKKNDKQL